MLNHKSSSGMTLLLLIIGLVIMSGLAASMSSFYNASNTSSVNDIGYLNAYYLAESGVRYAKLKQLAVGSYTYSLGTTGNIVSLVIDATKGTTSTGVYSSNTNLKSTRVISDSSYKGVSALPPVGNVLAMTGDAILYDKTTGNYVTDSSPNNNNGVIKGVTKHYPNNPIELTTGKLGNALQFYCDQYSRIVFPDIYQYDIFYSGTIMLWFNATNFNHDVAGLVHKGQSTDYCRSSDGAVNIFLDEVYTLQFFPAGKNSAVQLVFSIIDGDTYKNRCTGTWNYIPIYSKTVFTNSDSNKWYCVAVTWIYDPKTNSTKLLMYINGLLDSETEWTKPFKPRSNNAPLIIGSQQNSNTGDLNTYFCGVIDDVNIYSYPLTFEQVKAYYDKYK